MQRLKGEGVRHQSLGCKRVEVEESQEIRNSAGGRTFQHSAMLEKYHVPIMYPPQVQYSALASKTCKTPAHDLQKKAEGLFHFDVGLPWITGIAKRYFNDLLCIARTAKDAATRRASWVRAVLANDYNWHGLWRAKSTCAVKLCQLVTRISTQKSEAPGAWQKPNHQVEFWKASGLQPRQTGDIVWSTCFLSAMKPPRPSQRLLHWKVLDLASKKTGQLWPIQSNDWTQEN